MSVKTLRARYIELLRLREYVEQLEHSANWRPRDETSPTAAANGTERELLSATRVDLIRTRAFEIHTRAIDSKRCSRQGVTPHRPSSRPQRLKIETPSTGRMPGR